MTALDRARDWFIAPPPPSSTTTGWSAPPTDADPPMRTGRGSDDERASAAPAGGVVATGTDRSSNDHTPLRECRSAPVPVKFTPPIAPRADDRRESTRAVAPPAGFAPRVDDRRESARAAAPLAAFAPPSALSDDGPPRSAASPTPTSLPRGDRFGRNGASDRPRRGKRPPRPQPRESTDRGGWQPPVPGDRIAEPPRPFATVTSAAVLGRAGEVEPVAAALALALRLQTRAKAAAVAVVGAVPPEVEVGSSGAAARRLGARLEAHGLQPRVRGRLVWVELDPSDPQFAAAARRVTLVAAPAVLAVTAARTVAVDEALNEQDLLVIVTAEPEGPLAQLAATGLSAVPILTVRPLGRGPSRALARAGVRAGRPVRQLLTTVPEVVE